MPNPEALLIHETPGAPVACDLTSATDTPGQRVAEYGRLFAQALIDRQRTGDAVVFTFAARAGVAQAVADLARREAACCPFASYEVAFDGEQVVWRTSSQAGPAAQAILDLFCELPDNIGAGVEGLHARLAAHGFPIVARR